MAIEKPVWLQNGAYSARLDRSLIASMRDEGVFDMAAFAVTQRGLGANMSVDISAGGAVIKGDDQTNQGNYLGITTAVENRAVTVAPGANSRYDIVVVRVNDPNAGSAAVPADLLVLEVVAGTAAATPVAPAIPPTALLLATIGPITTSTTAITTAMIADARVIAGERSNVGDMKDVAHSRPVSGWLDCDGSAVSRTTYAALFATIDTTWGVGNGSTTFNLPDFRGRFAVPAAAGQIGSTRVVTGALGTSGGAKDGSLLAHTHTGPAHTHSIDHDHGSVNSGTVSNDHAHGFSGSTSTDGNHQHVYYRTDQGTGALQYGLDHFAPNFVGAASTAVAGNHAHTYSGNTGGITANHTHTVDLPNFSGASGSAGTGATGSTGSAGTDTNVPPFTTVRRLIRT